MDKADLMAFVTIARQGTILKAAKTLYISHSTLSWRLTRLEKELEAELFVRSKGIKHVELTRAGRTFLPYAERLLSTWQEATDALKTTRHESLSVVIGHNHNLLFNNVYKEFSTRSPNVPLYLLLRHSQEAYTYVKSGEMDAGFVATRHDTEGVDTIPLCREKMVLICGSGCEHRDAPRISPDILKAHNEIKWWISPSKISDWQLEHIGQEPKWLVQEDPNALANLLDGSSFWTIAPLSTAQMFIFRHSEGIIVRQLDFDFPSREIFLIVRKGSKSSPALDDFLQLIREDFISRGMEWFYN